MHILSVEQFDTKLLLQIFADAQALYKADSDKTSRQKLAARYTGRQMCSLFYEPSTRTRLSFEQAAAKFGMGLVSTENAGEFSSAAKGETLEDTIRVLNEYNFDAIVIRHPEKGSAAQAAAVSAVPIINAGDGDGEHPTQALLDMYTIYQQHGRLTNLRIVMGGDLRYGRTVRSLAKLLSKFEDNHITFVSVPELQIGQDIKTILNQRGTSFNETIEMHDALQDTDVVYWTRLQKERLRQPESVPSSSYVIDAAALKSLPKTAIIMHPLPRVGEIAEEVDADPRSKYFKQAGNGLYVRMALLDRILRD